MHRQQVVEEEYVQFFIPIAQAAPLAPGVVVFGFSGDADRVVPVAQRRMQASQAGLPYINVRALDELVAPRVRAWRLGATMLTVFGGLALLLAAIGLYSVLAYDVAERRFELGVRAALGAAVNNLATLVIGRGVRAVAIGASIGLLIAFFAAGAISSLLFRTSARDPLVYAGVSVVLLIVAVVATALPAFRATRVDPTEVLRSAS
jgi:ABC-type antimicrobial peptide transport system permease subunit